MDSFRGKKFHFNEEKLSINRGFAILIFYKDIRITRNLDCADRKEVLVDAMKWFNNY